MKSEFELFSDWVSSALANRQIHAAVQTRLRALLAKMFPDNPSVAEVFGVEGGRNDLIYYEQNGRALSLNYSVHRAVLTPSAMSVSAPASQVFKVPHVALSTTLGVCLSLSFPERGP